jgi:hypothetical protein
VQYDGVELNVQPWTPTPLPRWISGGHAAESIFEITRSP